MNSRRSDSTQHTGLAARLRSGDFVITAEVNPPVSSDRSQLLQRAIPLRGLNEAEDPRGDEVLSVGTVAARVERAESDGTSEIEVRHDALLNDCRVIARRSVQGRRTLLRWALRCI